MAFKKKQYDDDDGRVIADMNDIGRQPMIIPRFDHLHKSERRDMGQDTEQETRPEYEVQYSAEERRALIGGTVTAALLIGAVFIVAIGLLIFLITKIG
ncbi:MAG: hypothetical protein E7229_08050 [Clostridiales bacterium]|nr:hypothetical protein [Clostridiales bacterium]